MIRVRTLLAAAALAFLPALASARVGDLAIRCDSSPTGYVTRSQLESGSALGVRCQQEIDRAPICNEDDTHCACPNEGTAKDFVTCAWDLIAACEGQPGCVWWQNGSTGHVHCLCSQPLQPVD